MLGYMGRIFSQDSVFMRGLWWFTDIVLINIYLIITSIPIITVGASVTAAYDAARRSQESRGGLTRHYSTSFRKNFVQSTAIWIPMAAAGALLGYSWISLQIPLLLPFKILASFLWLLLFWWVFPVQSRFENPVGRTVSNSFIFGISHIITTAAILLIDTACLILVYVSYMYWIQSLFFLMVMGPGMMVALHVPLIERALRAYTGKSAQTQAG